MRAASRTLSEKCARLGHHMELGAGIVTGHVTGGMIGFEGRRDYSAIGARARAASPPELIATPRIRNRWEWNEAVSARP